MSICLSNKTPQFQLSCCDCGIVKTTTEQMDVHIKVEHLNWLPFQCPVCSVTRPSDSLMREHLFASHGQKTTKHFIYVDNMDAKRMLQTMMDKAIHSSIRRLAKEATVPKGDLETEVEPCSSTAKCQTPEPISGIPVVVTPTAGIVAPEIASDDSTMNALLASINNSVACDAGMLPEGTLTNNGVGEGGMNLSVLETFNSLVMGDITSLVTSACLKDTKKKENSARNTIVGDCSRCKKAISRGSRQNHIFLHLSRDEKIHRFRCLFDGCKFEIYRKDQIEIHQSKTHGGIDHKKIEDRAQELEPVCQEMAKILLGDGSFAHFSKAQELNEEGRSNTASPAVQDEKQVLHCQLCEKDMLPRLRGFHIQQHLSTDMGINRYVCKECGLASYYYQSVQKHGRVEHNSEDVVVDRIQDFSDDVIAMSVKCFGPDVVQTKDKRGLKRKFTCILTNNNYQEHENKIKVGSPDQKNSDNSDDELRIDEQCEEKQELEL